MSSTPTVLGRLLAPIRPDSGSAWWGAAWVLRVVVFLQCVGQWRLAHLSGTDLGEYLFETLYIAEGPMLAVEYTLAWVALAIGALTLVAAVPVALWYLAAYFLVDAVLGWVAGGSFAPELGVPAHAARVMAPMALAAMGWPAWRDGSGWRRVEHLLRIGAGVTFIVHGIEALVANPIFIDYLIGSARNLLGLDLEQGAVEVLLVVIGVVDVLVGALVLAGRRWRWVVAWMALWGLITACSRITHMGWASWPLAAVRAANGGLALALLLYWQALRRRVPAQTEE